MALSIRSYKPFSALLLLSLLGSCDQAKPKADTAAPAPPVAATAPAVGSAIVLTSGDTWPNTSHDTLRVRTGVVRVQPLPASAWSKGLPAGLPTRPDTVDSPQLSQAGSRVQRQGIHLLLTPANGRPLRIAHDTTDTDTAAYYYYWGTLPAAHQWVLAVGLYEGRAAALVDQRSGRRTAIWGQPVASPDGRYLVAYSADLGAAYDANGLQLFKIEPTGPRLLWQYSLNSWEPREVRWQDSKTLLVKQAPGPGGEEGEPQSGVVSLDLSAVL